MQFLIIALLAVLAQFPSLILATPQLISGLMNASEVILEQLKAGDRLIPQGLFESTARGMALSVTNAGNH
ncbi:MAG: hypothetical protein FRX48_04206 [Lasallia pustulata]|uniref:Uncharacterized protein n=1 Tax=Lasallia pustulata TaxID=136370 RepID=A0A5M8PTP7_9LECA|nr:MAG: hypothetical protein FRX48_04206 [Lasallia pustulata]